jgi:anti-sigma B factor antagonist
MNPETGSVKMDQKTLVEFSDQDQVLIASLDTDAVGISGIDAVSQVFREVILQRRPQNLVIDFTRVRFLTSLALGLLVDTWRRMKEYNGRLIICGINPQLMRVFRITHLDRIFEFSDDPASAVRAIKNQT